VSDDRVTRPYRIGWWTHAWWPSKHLLVGLATGNQPSRRADNGSRYVGRHRFVDPLLRRLRLLRRPHRPWQAESGEGWFCRRAFTPTGAERKIVRDMEHFRRYGVMSPYQYWRLWLKGRRGEVR
jgi:hypothetical protein